MSNVISFMQHREKEVAEPQPAYGKGSKTLFIHIRQTTMIVHLAAQSNAASASGRIGKS